MGQLVNGRWTTDDQLADASGKYQRKHSLFRSWISADGEFPPEPDRYHLYVSLACPWAHRTLIFRKLKGLESLVGLSVVHWDYTNQGWEFKPGEGVIADPNLNARFMHEIYCKAAADYTGRVTIPVLWDKHQQTIVSNESADIIRMFNSDIDALGAEETDYYPEPLREEIDIVNERVYETLNNGVYQCGFARSQDAYDAAIGPLFETLDWMEERLDSQRYLVGNTLTEADWRAFTTLLRFDAVYYGHFKCSIRRLVDYPNLWAYTRDLYQHPGVAETVNMEHIRCHYYYSHDSINPFRIVPAGPTPNFDQPHQRHRL